MGFLGASSVDPGEGCLFWFARDQLYITLVLELDYCLLVKVWFLSLRGLLYKTLVQFSFCFKDGLFDFLRRLESGWDLLLRWSEVGCNMF